MYSYFLVSILKTVMLLSWHELSHYICFCVWNHIVCIVVQLAVCYADEMHPWQSVRLSSYICCCVVFALNYKYSFVGSPVAEHRFLLFLSAVLLCLACLSSCIGGKGFLHMYLGVRFRSCTANDPTLLNITKFPSRLIVLYTQLAIDSQSRASHPDLLRGVRS